MGAIYRFNDTELSILEKQPVPLAVYQFVDRHVYTLALSDGFCELFGYTDKADAYRISNLNSLNNTHPDDAGRVGDAVHRFITEGGRYEVIFRAKMYGDQEQGEEQNREQDCHIVHAIGEHIHTETGERLAYVWFTDEGEYTADDSQIATLNKVFNHALHEESFLKSNCYDSLTGLPNMTYFFSLAEEGKTAIKKNGGKAALLYMDLDGMKSYNDNYGFAEGDKLLKEFAKILDNTFGNENCCHISADHFAVLCEEDGLEDVLRRVFAESEKVNGGNSLQVRVGIYPDDIEEVPMSSACDRAKMACDIIPNSASSSFRMYSRELGLEIKKRQYILSHIDRAISEKWIQVYYQPIVRAVSGKVCNEEALARWIDPEKGFLSPADFIPTLENEGLIYKVDLFVLDQVLEKIRTLEKAGLHIVPQSINLSRSDFDACDMVEEIRKRVDASGISHDRLTIEITESIIGSDFEFIRTQVERFRRLGFPVWMDDFGSGYSSLDVLQSIRFDLIKFDMSFMRKLEEGDSGRIILTELMKMATSLGVDTICEGVETEEQVRFLQTIGCSKLQGFYYLKPIPLETILERYEKGIQIGFENPEETGYYDAMGRINLYDLSFMASLDENVFLNIFDTIPMGIVEISAAGEWIRFIRSNQSFHGFVSRTMGFDLSDNNKQYATPTSGNGSGYMRSILEILNNMDREFIDEPADDGSVIHSFSRKIYTNPVTGSTAVAVAILSIDRPGEDTASAGLRGLLPDNIEDTAYRGQEGDTSREAYEEAMNARAVYARLYSLTGNYICVYVVDPENGHYREFTSVEDYEDKFAQAKEGTDFFAALHAAAREYTHPEDLDRVLPLLRGENIMSEVGRNGSYSTVYRIRLDGRYIYVQMNAAMVEGKEGSRLIVGLNNVDAQYRQREHDKEIARQKDVYDQITASLAEQYDTLYYIDIETNTYLEISSTDEYKRLNVPATGNDFFAESRRSIRKYVHPEDQDKVVSLHYKDVMLKNLSSGHSYSMNWRLVVNGKVRHIRHTEVLSKDGKHIIVCIKNIDAEVQAQLALKEDQRRSVTYTQIAERLADHFDMIYYIDCETTHYAELSSKRKTGVLKIQEEGEHFFETARKNADILIYAEDRDRIKLFLDRDQLISRLENVRQLTEDYRMVLDAGIIQYTRMSVTYSSDHTHFIICVENRDENVRREQEHLAELALANEMARRDELTHTKNKTAYHEMEKELQLLIDEECQPFGIVVCDINGLKTVNDTMGHKAGDAYIKAACMLICRIFHHSPVFRIGGDEFVVTLRGDDYENRESLLLSLRGQVEENIRIGEGAVVASGLAEYRPGDDRSVEDVFNRADSRMYEDKMRLKERKLLKESHALKEKADLRTITEERRNTLDTMYNAFEALAEGGYVILCDMMYDFSRWSKDAVDTYGLPSEYMYGAEDIWENQIHPEDRIVYHKGFDELLSGNTEGHDMQFRAKRISGGFDLCLCRVIIIRDSSGEPDYYVGRIRISRKE